MPHGRLSCILSYTNHESGKFESFHMQTAWQYNPRWGPDHISRAGPVCPVCYTAIFSVVTRRAGALRDETKNGFVADYGLSGWLALAEVHDFYPGITWKGPVRSHHFYIEVGYNAREQCVTRCPVSGLVYLPGRPASEITWKISTRDPSITILGSQQTGLARLSYNRKVDFCCFN